MTIHSQDQNGSAAGGDAATVSPDTDTDTDAARHRPRIDFDRALKVLEDAEMLVSTKVWTPVRQAHFLAMIAEGTTVAEAARSVGVAERTAYSFRRRAAGSTFDIGWRAANLLARDKLHDELYRRCFKGQKLKLKTVIDAPDGQRTIVSRRRMVDNRLGLAMLTRLDRLAEDSNAPGAYPAQLIAMDYDAYLARVATNAGGAEIERLLRRLAREFDEAGKTDLAAPVPDDADAPEA